MTRVALVTGATGGVGRTLVPLLAAHGWRVRATGRTPGGEDRDILPLDLTQPLPPGLCAGVDTVFHLAARSSPWGPRAAFAAINHDATRRLAAAARDAGCRRFVHVSTPSIYVTTADRMGITERDAPAPRFANAYAATKWQAEQVVRDAGIPATILRPHAIVGPHDTVLLPRLLRAVARGRVPLPAGGRALVELTDVRDVAAALIAAADAPPTTANLSGGAALTVRAIVERIAARLARPVRIVALPRPVAMAGAAVLEGAAHVTGREPLLTRYTVAALGWSRTFNLSHARAVLGWAPAITPEDAIDHALDARCAR
ncbi:MULTISPECIES: NAD-dependent epimerase/dehydratase family protein [Sphingomonas]|uniref:NAD-dependent epimerase/dehydratase family protein n=1 Tax=Sphingomonas TaxID=13687 RepID=UPI0014737B67|nr:MULTISPECIES: NAD-dependent epimerase/dehydratase family protein [Sphingomonas]